MSFAKFKMPQSGNIDGVALLDELSQSEAPLGPGASLPLLPLPLDSKPDPLGALDTEMKQDLEFENTAAPHHASADDEKCLTSEERNEGAVRTLIKRLSDLLFLSSGAIAPQERALSDDLISRLFGKADRTSKLKLVERMLQHSEPPPALVRTMLHSEDEIALPILRSLLKLQQADLISVVTTCGAVYQKCVAEREGLHSAVCDAIIQCADAQTIRVMLRNGSAAISRTGFVRLAEKSLENPEILEPLIERTDFPPDMAHLVFGGLLRQCAER